MAPEPLTAATPLGPWSARLTESCSGSRFAVAEDAFRVLTEVRCAHEHEGAASEAVAAGLPAVGRVVNDGHRLVVGLGPGWWMVDAPAGDAPVPGSAGVSAVEVSAQRTPLVLTGTAVRDVLAHGCSLDLHPDHFGVDAAAQTLLAKAGIVLARTGFDQYRVWVRASFARYLAEWIIDASVEYR